MAVTGQIGIPEIFERPTKPHPQTVQEPPSIGWTHDCSQSLILQSESR